MESIQAGTVESISMIEAALFKAHAGEAAAQSAGGAINGISVGAKQVMSGVSEMSASIHEQSLASRDIAAQIECIAIKSEENNASISSVQHAMRAMATLSGSLKRLSDNFRI